MTTQTRIHLTLSEQAKVQEWLDALESGRYKPGKRALCQLPFHDSPPEDMQYCCLGVKAKLLGWEEQVSMNQFINPLTNETWGGVISNAAFDHDFPMLSKCYGGQTFFSTVNDFSEGETYAPIINVLRAALRDEFLDVPTTQCIMRSAETSVEEAAKVAAVREHWTFLPRYMEDPQIERVSPFAGELAVGGMAK
jgi:hypothetical protein